ncbi:MAG: hypothetical protein M1825_001670 [Sarcosagium campestre]|nr:MAG: hypothetical protein M1825_001670 [Sarcosagium campestre]
MHSLRHLQRHYWQPSSAPLLRQHLVRPRLSQALAQAQARQRRSFIRPAHPSPSRPLYNLLPSSTQRSPLLRQFAANTVRHESTAAAPTKAAAAAAGTTLPSPQGSGRSAPPRPTYQLTFTCKPCKTRSVHDVSKQGYHKGTVLITCPECKNRHVISDHLKIFSDKPIDIEDLMRQNGERVKLGTLSAEGDVEFWDDVVSEKGKADKANAQIGA